MNKTRFEMIKVHNCEQLECAITEGKADQRMIKLCRFVNSTKNFFTSSSCAGRIALLSVQSIGKKQPKAFHRKWHRKVTLKEVVEGLEEKASEKELWFKLDPFILHIGTDNLENARTILKCMRLAGIKRGGIMLAKEEKFIVELQGTHTISLPIRNNDVALVDKEYLSFIIKQANDKLTDNYERLKRFEQVCRKELK
jgi:tRNA wybutosine-synthesizing protein 3